MSTAIRPCINSSVALLVAGAVAATPIVMLPAHQAAPALSTVAVRPASSITDALNLFGDLVDFGFDVVSAPVIGIDGLPEFAIAAGVVALKHPGLAPSALSALVQLALNPAYPGAAGFVLLNLELVKNFLPPTLGPSVSKDLQNSAATIGGLFTGLPDPTTGFAAMASFLKAPGPAQVLSAVTQVVPSALAVTHMVVSWAAHLPGTLEATVESAIRTPGQIPGLLSNLVTGVLGQTGLLANVAQNLELPLVMLPKPIGGNTGLVATFVQNVVNGVSSFVGHLLPTPVTPKPFAAVAPSKSAAPTATAASTAVAGSTQTGTSQPNKKHADKHSSHHVTSPTGHQDKHHK